VPAKRFECPSINKKFPKDKFLFYRRVFSFPCCKKIVLQYFVTLKLNFCSHQIWHLLIVSFVWKAFRALERPGEVSRMFAAQNFLWDRRHNFISSVSNFNWSSATPFPEFLSLHLARYEESIYTASHQGVHQVPRDTPDAASADASASWGYLHSVFFASTVLTTIGQQN